MGAFCGVWLNAASALSIMWSVTYLPKNCHDYQPNHFVVLHSPLHLVETMTLDSSNENFLKDDTQRPPLPS